ncbi:hypothetical protein HPHPP16_0659 [Helicobacter pylori Hp P-16]|uniref:hypothetical protein n=1 Tax=Helicobacter pylori TaxID=210 RepID=UPI00026AB573|nr:hypothetical protein [Helicobacter pylori]EJC11336.1 hypothetical protein HPHPP16_0659 [Helicobacter pylori Hp P-16]
MNYPNPPSPEITTKEKPAFKEITSELLRELESALNNATSWEEQVNLSLKGVKRILEVITGIDFFQKANEIDERLRGVLKWLENSSNGLQTKIREYESYLTDFNASMRANEQEVTNILNANTQNIESEIKKLENQLIETTTKLLTSYQIFLNQAKENANNEINTNKTASLEAINQAKNNANNEISDNKTQAITNINEAKESANNEINTNKTQAITNINEAKESANNEINTNKTQAITNINEAKENATNQINTNKQEVLNNITQAKTTVTSEITEAKKTAFNELLETLKPKFSGLFIGVYYIRNAIYIQGGWERKVKDLSDYALEKSKKYEIEVFFQFVSARALETSAVFGLKVQEGFLKESIQKITHKYIAQTYHIKLLVENVSGVLSLYHGYFYGNINYFNESLITSIREIPNDTIISKVSNGSTFSNATTIAENLNETSNTTPTRG